MATSTSLGAVGGLAATRYGAITRRLAAEHGITHQAVARLIARQVLVEPVPGVLCVAGSPPTWEQRAMVATLAGGDRNVLIGTTAARVHQLDGFAGDEELHIAVASGCRPARLAATCSQTLSTYAAADVTTVSGLRVSGLARTLCDLAQFHPDAYERAADDYQRRGASLAWLSQTAQRLQQRGRPGPAVVLADVARRRDGGRVRDSWFEALVERCVRSPHIPPVVPQFVVRDAAGRFVARVDLAIPSLRLAIEAHSRSFHTGPRRETSDQHRDNMLAIEGWQVTYVGWMEATRTPTQLCAMIERLVARRLTDLGVSRSEAS